MNKFEKFHSRKDESSAKWLLMKEKSRNPLEGVIPMSVADMEFETADAIVNGLKDYIESTILGYTVPSEEYFLSVINHYKRKFDVSIEKDHIIPIMGVVPGLLNAIKSVTKAGEGVIIFTPVYPQFYSAINLTGRKEMKCPLKYTDNEYHIDFELFEEIAKYDNSKALILCSPHNPSGRIWSIQELEKILEICRKYDLTLISDEIHADLGLYGNKIKSIFNLTNSSEDKILVFSSASKTYNIAGLQTANAISKNEDLIYKFKAETEKIGFHGPNMLGLKATELAYNQGDTWLKQAIKVIEENLDLTKKFFNSYDNLFKVYNTKSTYLAWVNFENFAKKYGLTAKEFCIFLDDSNFFAHPGIIFGRESKYFIRINIALPSHKYKENLDRLKKEIKNEFNI